MDDNWKHRSTTMKCSSCMWFTQKVPTDRPDRPDRPEKTAGDSTSILGRCKRHSPCTVVIGWPVVFSTDWCGDHKIDENKI